MGTTIDIALLQSRSRLDPLQIGLHLLSRWLSCHRSFLEFHARTERAMSPTRAHRNSSQGLMHIMVPTLPGYLAELQCRGCCSELHRFREAQAFRVSHRKASLQLIAGIHTRNVNVEAQGTGKAEDAVCNTIPVKQSPQPVVSMILSA